MLLLSNKMCFKESNTWLNKGGMNTFKLRRTTNVSYSDVCSCETTVYISSHFHLSTHLVTNCVYGVSVSPQNLVRWCDSSPCKNGGTCWQTGTTYSCECQTGWTGLYCDVPSVSCEVAAKQRGNTGSVKEGVCCVCVCVNACMYEVGCVFSLC